MPAKLATTMTHNRSPAGTENSLDGRACAVTRDPCGGWMLRISPGENSPFGGYHRSPTGPCYGCSEKGPDRGRSGHGESGEAGSDGRGAGNGGGGSDCGGGPCCGLFWARSAPNQNRG